MKLQCCSLQSKRDYLFELILKDEDLRAIFRSNHPLIRFSYIDATDEAFLYSIKFKEDVLPHILPVCSFIPDFFAFSMGKSEAMTHFSKQFYKSLRYFFIEILHKESSLAIEKLETIIDGEIQWDQVSELINLITCEFAINNILQIGTLIDAETFTVGYRSIHPKITMQPLIVHYEKLSIEDRFRQIHQESDTDLANFALKEMFIMDFVSDLYHKASKT